MEPSAAARALPVPERGARGLLLMAVLLGLSRFLRLGDWGLWVDEAHTLHDALWMFSGPGPDYPLGYLAVRATVALLGQATDEASLRLFPALCGFASIPLTAWALWPAVGRRRASAAALLVALSSWHVFWSQNARGYTLALLLSLIGGGLWLRGLTGERRALVVAGVAIGTLGAFAHPSAALLLPTWVLAPLLLRPLGAPLRPALPVGLLIGLAIVGAVALGGWTTTVWSTYEAVKRGPSWSHFVATTGWYMTPPLLVGALAGAWIAVRRRRAEDVLLTLVVAGVGLAALFASLFVRVAAQYVFVLLPWVAALATLPFTLSPRPRLRWGWIALLAAFPALDSVLYFTVRHGDRPRWKEAYAYVWEQRGPDDLVLGMHAPVGEYYLRPGKTWLRTQEALVRLDEHHADEPALWLRRGRRVWLVINPEDLMAWSAQGRRRFRALLDSEARLVTEFGVPWTPRNMLVRVYTLN